MIERQYQPPGSKLCGHTCVAMAIGKPLTEVVEILGRIGGTTTKDLVRMFRVFGFQCKDRLTRFNKIEQLPVRALVKMSYGRNQNWHWVLWWDGDIYDPSRNSELTGHPTAFLDLTSRSVTMK